MSDLRIKPLQPKIDQAPGGSLQSTDRPTLPSTAQSLPPEEKAPVGGSTLPIGALPPPVDPGALPWLIDWLASKDTWEVDPGMMWASYTSHGGEHISFQGQPVPYTAKAGLILWHKCPNTESGWDVGSITFDIPEMERWTSTKWKVKSWDPLTLEPSIQHNQIKSGVKIPDTCPLGHGFIENGKWRRA